MEFQWFSSGNSLCEFTSMQSIRSIRGLCKIALFLISSVLACGTDASGQSRSEPGARTEDLTKALVSLNLSYQRSGPRGRSALVDQMLATAAERRKLLASMVESEPGRVLRVALTSEFRASLPAAVRSDVEQHVVLDGTIEVLQEDYASGARLRHFLDTGGTRLSLHFAVNPPGHLTGDRVRVRGVLLDNMLALDSGTTSLQILTASPAGRTPLAISGPWSCW